MRSLQDYLAAYEQSHRHPVNKRLHRVCVPLITVSLLGMFWAVPLPLTSAGAWANLYLPFVLVSLIFYFRLSLRLGLSMAALSLILGFIFSELAAQFSLWPTCLIIFILAWIGQFWGHKIEGKRPSFFQDLLFLLIGPIWVLGPMAPSKLPAARSY